MGIIPGGPKPCGGIIGIGTGIGAGAGGDGARRRFRGRRAAAGGATVPSGEKPDGA